MAKNENRCWPGYEPVPGKEQHEQGSCRKKAASKSSPSDKKAQQKRAGEVARMKKARAAKKAPAKKPTGVK